ncbi:MAG: hypothetical protein HZA91_02315 [Verrucomicrobia bacterium]|nr:hypothetical protein [Verrucomicrobiota bacterium]
MNKTTRRQAVQAALGVCCLAGIAAGCAGRQAVYAVTGTTLGVEIAQNPSTQMYQAKLGYNRAEMAIVPTNRSANEEPNASQNGAADCADVMMEFRFSGVFSTGPESGIYQRLAVGREAVRNTGAAFLFAKGHDGQLKPDTAAAVLQSLRSVPSAPMDVDQAKRKLQDAFDKAGPKQADFHAVAKEVGRTINKQYDNFNFFLSDERTSMEVVKKMEAALREKHLLP